MEYKRELLREAPLLTGFPPCGLHLAKKLRNCQICLNETSPCIESRKIQVVVIKGNVNLVNMTGPGDVNREVIEEIYKAKYVGMTN